MTHPESFQTLRQHLNPHPGNGLMPCSGQLRTKGDLMQIICSSGISTQRLLWEPLEKWRDDPRVPKLQHSGSGWQWKGQYFRLFLLNPTSAPNANLPKPMLLIDSAEMSPQRSWPSKTSVYKQREPKGTNYIAERVKEPGKCSPQPRLSVSNWDTDAQQTCKFRLGVFAKPLQCYNGTVGQESIVPIWITTSFGILKHNLTWSFIFVFCTVLLYKGASNSCFRTVSFNLIQYVERHYPRRSQLLLGGAIWFPNESLPENRKHQILEIEAELCTWFELSEKCQHPICEPEVPAVYKVVGHVYISLTAFLKYSAIKA